MNPSNPAKIYGSGNAPSSIEPVSKGVHFIFAIYGIVDFAPRYTPSRMSVVKERNLDREENFCGNEDVSDLGSKNRDIHISGTIRQSEVDNFNSLLDLNEPVQLINPVFTGEVRVNDGDIEGPNQIDPQNQEFLYQYTLNLVSTGANETEFKQETI